MIRCLPYEPVPDDQVIWHYTDFSKFFGMLESKQLHFTTALELRKKEPYELRVPVSRVAGVIAETTRQLDSITGLEPDVRARILADVADDTKHLHHFAVSCWHRSDMESYAMWKAFTNGNDGIAIKTTVGRLKQALRACHDQLFHDGNVRYIDYSRDDFQPNGYSSGFEHLFHKARFYEHEREYRLVVGLKLPVGKTFNSYKEMLEDPITDGSRRVDIDIAELIEGIVVCPYAAGWFKPTVEAYLGRSYPAINVTHSAVLSYPGVA